MNGLPLVWSWVGDRLGGFASMPKVWAFSWEDALGLIFFLLVVFLQRRSKPTEAEQNQPAPAEPVSEPKPVQVPRPEAPPTPPLAFPAPPAPLRTQSAEPDPQRIELLAVLARLRTQVRNLEASTKSSTRAQVVYEYVAHSLRPRVELFSQQYDNRQESAETVSYAAIHQELQGLKAELAAVAAWKAERYAVGEFATSGVAEALVAEWTGLLQRTANAGETWPIRSIVATRLSLQTVQLLEAFAAKIGVFFVPLAALRVETPLQTPLIARSVFHMLMRWHPQFANDLRAAWSPSSLQNSRSDLTDFVALLADMWAPVLIPDMLAVWVTGPTVIDRVMAPPRRGTEAVAYSATAAFDGTRWSAIPPPIVLVLCGCSVLRRNGLADMATRLLDAWQEKVGRSDVLLVTLNENQRISVPLELVSAELTARIERTITTKLNTLAGYSLANIPGLAYSQVHRDDRERVVLWLRQGLPGSYSPRAVADGALALASQENADIRSITAAFLKAILGSELVPVKKIRQNGKEEAMGAITLVDLRRAVVDQELFARYELVRQARKQRFVSARSG